jgi:hypothetical protein
VKRVRHRSLVLAGVLLLACVSGAAASGIRVAVTPHTGASSGTFIVSYVAPRTTGVVGSTRIRNEVRAQTGSVSGGCQSLKSQFVPAAKRGQHVRVALRAGAGWCSGTYSGKLVELVSPVCPPGSMCPQYLRIRTLGTFTFVVD